MRRITSEQFQADPAAAWRDVDESGDLEIYDNGRRRMTLHRASATRDPRIGDWEEAIELTKCLEAEIEKSELPDDKKRKMQLIIKDIWERLYWASDLTYSLDKKTKKEPRQQ